MAMRIAPRPIPAKAKPEKSKDYLAWLHELPCIVSGQSPVEAAHVSYANPVVGASGRGKAQKASDRWAVPLHPDLHRAQHEANEREWWLMNGINPHMVALVLWGLWNELKAGRSNDATERATALIRSGLGRIPGGYA